jgi:general stress protein 26
MKKSYYLLFAVLAILPIQLKGQHLISQDSSKSRFIAVAKEIIESAGICALTSLDQDGLPRVRPMDAFSPESDMTVWFGTNAHSRKVKQIENDPRVSLYYFDEESGSYVLIQGMAELVDDPIEKERRWKKEWEAFYPNKQDDYLLIKVSPIWLELISEKLKVFGDEKTWEAPRLVF